MGLFELFELCDEATQPPMGEGRFLASARHRDETADAPMPSAELFWPAMVSAVLVCLGLLQAFAAT